jgi:hypothetical protein
MLLSLVPIGLVVSEEKIFEKFTRDDDGRQVMAIAHMAPLLLFPEFEFETYQNSNHFGDL